MESVADPKVWAEFGIAGLVILALFVFVFYILKMHRDERGEWRQDSKQSNEKVIVALDSLKDVIRNQR